MRKVTTYYAWDDTAFYFEKDCIEYEQQAINSLNEIREKWILFNKQREALLWPNTQDIDDLLDWFDTNFNETEYIRVKANLSEEAEALIHSEWGFIIPDHIGTWKYDWKELDWKEIGD